MNLLRLGFLIESKHELPDTFSITITPVKLRQDTSYIMYPRAKATNESAGIESNIYLPLEDRKVFDSFKVGDVIELTEKIVERK